LSSEALLAGSGISAADLNPRRHAHHHHQEMQVCANAVALKRDIGLVGPADARVLYGILGYALLTCATFGDALRLAMRYPALLGTLFELSLEEDGERSGSSLPITARARRWRCSTPNSAWCR
jgi:hypothetical protein